MPGLAPGDQVAIRLYDFPDLTDAILVHVSDDGSVHLPYAGTVKAQGLSPNQLQEAISDALKSRGIVKDPNVTVDVQSAVNLTVNVIGEVLKPATIPLYAPAPVSYVLTQAGGMTGLASTHVTILHPGGVEPTKLEYDKNAPTAAVLHTMVKPGDIVHVSSAGVFFMGGEVARPGIYPIGGTLNTGQITGVFGAGVARQMTLLTALSQAGGITSIAARSQMRIIRTVDGRREEIKVDQVKLYKGEIADPMILPDDIIYVPSSYIRTVTNNLFGTAVQSAYAAAQLSTIR
ncbi:MAG TPA: polysaccharide biosynthesis/export family protein [Acidobacteriaceae bacterium]